VLSVGESALLSFFLAWTWDIMTVGATWMEVSILTSFNCAEPDCEVLEEATTCDLSDDIFGSVDGDM